MEENPKPNGAANNVTPSLLAGAPTQPPPLVLGKSSSPTAPPPSPTSLPPTPPSSAAPPPLPTNTPPSPPPQKLPPLPQVAQPPKESKTIRGSNRGLKLGLSIAAAGVLLVCAIGIAIAVLNRSGASGRGSTGAFFSRKDTVEDYVFLCETMLDKIKLVNGVEPSQAEVTVAARNRQHEFTRISAQGAALAEITQSLLAETAKRGEVLTNLPDGRAFFSGSGNVLAGLNSGSNQQVISGLEKALPELIHGLETYEKLTESLNYQHGMAIKLAKLAPKFSGPMTDAGALPCSFEEYERGLILVDKFQTLSVSNSFGSNLHNCVIFVRLSDVDGASYANVHFAPLWPKAGRLQASYTDTDVTTKRLDNATRVEITVWTRENSFEPRILTRPREGWPGPK